MQYQFDMLTKSNYSTKFLALSKLHPIFGSFRCVTRRAFLGGKALLVQHRLYSKGSTSMLASPLYPAQPFPAQLTSDDHSQLRPAKDIDAFNSLLPPPIEFIEGSSTGTLAVPEDKYEPINSSPKANKVGTAEYFIAHMF